VGGAVVAEVSDDGEYDQVLRDDVMGGGVRNISKAAIR